ncbi:MAG TPA: efflux RND transporter periplasmic adaptor subunit [Oscillatoriales cyanobacterium M4454_W2019_049]|nr:efflux RND transporter periplasmic adaptor subunit [Oscillatoriales cyanobacterium M4454_W2019_049]
MELPFLSKLKEPPRWLIGLAAVGIIGTAAGGIIVARRGNPELAALEELLVPVEAQTVTIRIQASGEIQPVQRVNLSPKTSGRLAQLYVEQGDRVSEGEIVARMESEDADAQLRQAEARLAQAQATLAQLRNGSRPEEIDSAAARANQARATLKQLRNGSRPEEIDSAEARVEQARSRWEQTRAQLTQLQNGTRSEEIAEAEAALQRTQAQVAESRSRLDLARADLRRNRQLEADGAISRNELDRAVDEERRAVANLEQTEAAVREAQMRLERLENGTRVEEIDKARADVENAEAAVAEAEAQLAEVRNGTRVEEIDKAEAAVAEAEAQLAEVRNGTRVEEIDKAEAAVAEAEAQVRFYESQLEDSIVRAPFTGIITQRYADPGAFVTPATSASTASGATSTSIMALAKGLEVLAKVPEADIGQIKPGQTVEIVADAYPDEVFEGRVKLIAPEAVRERDVTLFQVRLDIETGQEKLRSGMNVDLTFLGEKIDNALVVPTVAIVTKKGQTGVLIPDDENKAQFREVTIGATIGNKIQILEGVDAGDKIFLGLPEGQKLEDIIGD